MKRGSISISISGGIPALILALQLALLLAGAGAGAGSPVADDKPAIRLPSDAKGAAGNHATEGNSKLKPWGDCCDFGICTMKYPPSCLCEDQVESCSGACEDCEKVSTDPPRYVCRDWYHFDVEEAPFKVPSCKELKPWGDCCDLGICTRSDPPICRCTDKVESCSGACKACEQVSSDPPRYACQDQYRFDREEAPYVIPKCKELKPWGDCCDFAICTRSYPPICSCEDQVESCSTACEDCDQVSYDPPRYVCQDQYHFKLEEAPFVIPKCE